MEKEDCLFLSICKPSLMSEPTLMEKRRKLIREKLRDKGKITTTEIKHWQTENGDIYSLKKLRQDFEFIRFYDSKRIAESKNFKSGEFEWVDMSRTLGVTREERKAVQSEAKHQICELLTALLLGFKTFKLAQENKAITNVIIDKRDQILEQLKFFRKNIKDLEETDAERKLRTYWQSSKRNLFLDSGSSTQTFAEDYLKHFPITVKPFEEKEGERDIYERDVNNFEVITNDRHIFFVLGDPRVPIKTVVIGGRMQYRSSALSGVYAEKFLSSNQIFAGMGIVGTTDICVNDNEHPYICAENEHVAAIKLQFLERSNLRIVIADSSKFRDDRLHGDTRICEIRPSQIDLIITDKADPSMVNRFKHLGVPLITYPLVESAKGRTK